MTEWRAAHIPVFGENVPSPAKALRESKLATAVSHRVGGWGPGKEAELFSGVGGGGVSWGTVISWECDEQSSLPYPSSPSGRLCTGAVRSRHGKHSRANCFLLQTMQGPANQAEIWDRTNAGGGARFPGTCHHQLRDPCTIPFNSPRFPKDKHAPPLRPGAQAE